MYTAEEFDALCPKSDGSRLYAGSRQANVTVKDVANMAFTAMLSSAGINDTVILRSLKRQGIDAVMAADGIKLAREWMLGSNPARLQRSVGSDSYVDGQTRRSTI